MVERNEHRREGFRKGFRSTGQLVEARIRKGAETRGFAVARVLTHWNEIAGPEIASMARPVDVSYGRGFGGTLTLLTTGAHAPVLEMEKEALRERVNACYGYAAIARVRITQTAPTGFAEGQLAFAPPPPKSAPMPDPAARAEAHAAVRPVRDDDLRAALEALGANVLSRGKSKRGPSR